MRISIHSSTAVYLLCGACGLGKATATSLRRGGDGDSSVLVENGHHHRSLTAQTYDGTWRKVSGWASDIGAGPYGIVIIGDKHSIWKLARDRHSFDQIEGGATHVAVGDDSIHVTNPANYIYEYVNRHLTATRRWVGDGSLEAVDIGVSGDTVCVVGDEDIPDGQSDYEIHCKTRGSGGFHQIDGGGVRIDVCPDGNPVVINSRNIMYRYTGSKWEHLPGKFVDVACGPDGVVWATGVDGGVHRWRDSHSSWEQLPGEGVRISIDKYGVPWVVTSHGTICEYEPGPSWNGGIYGFATDVGAGGYGVFAIGGHHSIWQFDDPGTWNQLSGGADQVAVGDDTIQVSNPSNYIYEYVNEKWVKDPSTNATDIGISGDTVCVIGDKYIDGSHSDFEIHCKKRSGGGYHQIHGGGIRIDVCPNGNPVVVNSHMALYSYTGSAWEHLPGHFIDVACGPDGMIWSIDADRRVCRWINSSWEKSAAFDSFRISIDKYGIPWVATTIGTIYEHLPGEEWSGGGIYGFATDIGAGANGVVAIGGHDSIWKYDGAGTWNQLPGGARQVAVGDDNIQVTNPSNYIYEYVNDKWVKDPSTNATDIGISGDTVCVISDAGGPSADYGILCKKQGQDEGFNPIQGGAVRIDVCPTGNPVVVNSSNTVHAYNGLEWHALGGGLFIDVACGPDGVMWAVGTDGGVYRWLGHWERLPGGGNSKRISVDNAGIPWVVTYAGTIYQHQPAEVAAS